MCLYDSADNGAQAQLTARWLYRTFLCDFVNDPKYMINAWKSLSKGGMEWPALHEMAFIAEQEGNDAAEIADHIKSTLIPLIREENRKNYTSILLYSDCSDIPKESRNENHKKKIHSFLADQIFYYRYVGMRPDEALNESLQLTELVKSIIYNHLCESSDETRERGGRISSKNIAALWDFIEKEAIQGRDFLKMLYPHGTLAAYLQANDKTGRGNYNERAEFDTEAGLAVLEAGFGVIPMNGKSARAGLAIWEKLTRQIPGDLTGQPLERIIQYATVAMTAKEYNDTFCHGDLKEAREELRNGIRGFWNLELPVNGAIVKVAAVMDDRALQDNSAEIPEKETKEQKKARELAEYGDPFKNGVALFTFNPIVVQAVSKAPVPYFPLKMWQTNPKQNPYSSYIMFKLCVYHHTRIRKGQGGANRISVRSMVEWLRPMGLPVPDDISGGKYKEGVKYGKGKTWGRHITQQCINPLDRDFTACKTKYGLLSVAQYCGPNGVKIEDYRIEEFNYWDWLNWNMEFEIIGYPDVPKQEKPAGSGKGRNKKSTTRKTATKTT